MKKHFYEQPVIEIVKLETLDVIMTSSVGDNQIDDKDIIWVTEGENYEY